MRLVALVADSSVRPVALVADTLVPLVALVVDMLVHVVVGPAPGKLVVRGPALELRADRRRPADVVDSVQTRWHFAETARLEAVALVHSSAH